MYSHKALKLSSYLSAFCRLCFFIAASPECVKCQLKMSLKYLIGYRIFKPGHVRSFRFNLTQTVVDMPSPDHTSTIKTTKLKS